MTYVREQLKQSIEAAIKLREEMQKEAERLRKEKELAEHFENATATTEKA